MAILTKVHTFDEMRAKTDFVRESGIIIPILFVPSYVQKSSVYMPKPGDVLIDDNLNNLQDWKAHGGTSIYFNEQLEDNPEFLTIETLKKIL